MYSTILLSLLASSVLADDITAQSLGDKYQCVGTFIFGRHNDRVAKPATVLTGLGAERQVVSGNFYRERYFGLTADGNKTSSDFVIDGLNKDGVFIYGETYSQCPASTVLEYSQLSFLQGLYPPTSAVSDNKTLSEEEDSSLSNGTQVDGPFNGYQYVFMDVQQETSDNYFYIEGDSNCPTSDDAAAKWNQTDEYKELYNSTYDFYQSLSSILPEKKFPKKKLSFKNAMSIFDYLNVNYIHNSDLAKKYNETLLRKVALLADKAQWGISYNSTEDASSLTIGGQSILGAVYNYLNTTKVEGSPYINYFIGSYDIMYQLAGLLQLNKVSDNFTGMPDYGSTYVWDLLKDSNGGYHVMFSFKNGTDDDAVLKSYPMFGNESNVMDWDDFESAITLVSITDLSTWCNSCNSQSPQCKQYSTAYQYGTELEDNGVDLSSLASGKTHIQKGSLTNAGAGGIGAGVTIGVFLILGALGYLFYRMRSQKSASNAEGRTLADGHERISLNSNSQRGRTGSGSGASTALTSTAEEKVSQGSVANMV